MAFWPTPSLLHGSIFIATDGIIYPTTLEYFSFTGLIKSLEHREKFASQRQNMGLGDIVTVGIVPMMYQSKTIEHSENLKSMREQFGNLVWRPVPRRIAWAEAAMMRRPVWNGSTDSKAAADAWAIVEHAIGALEHV